MGYFIFCNVGPSYMLQYFNGVDLRFFPLKGILRPSALPSTLLSTLFSTLDMHSQHGVQKRKR